MKLSELKQFDVIVLDGLGSLTFGQSKCEFVVLGLEPLGSKIQIKLFNVASSQIVKQEISFDTEFEKVGQMVFHST